MNIPNFKEKEILLKIKSIRSTYCQEKKKIASTDKLYVTNLRWFGIIDEALKYVNSEVGHPQDNLDDPDKERNVESNIPETNDISTDQHEPLPVFIPRNSPRKRKFVSHNNPPTEVKSSSIINTQQIGENEFDIFAKCVAAQMKNMPLTLALEAQQHIQSYLSQIRIKHLLAQQSVPFSTLQVQPVSQPNFVHSSPPVDYEYALKMSPSSTITPSPSNYALTPSPPPSAGNHYNFHQFEYTPRDAEQPNYQEAKPIT